jgi:ABC-type transport system substrate-binding protein
MILGGLSRREKVDYWSQALAKRIARRRALAGATTLGLGAAAASLIGCGGGDGDSGEQPAGSSLVTKPVDSTKRAVKGGVMTSLMAADSPHFDHMTGDNLTHNHTTHVYSRLLRFKPGTVDDPPDGTVDADAVTQWEVSTDGLQVTMKMRPNNKLDARPPTNGRPLNSGDVKFSWERFEKVALARVSLAKSASPDAPIDSVSYPDSLTVVWKLAYPLGHILKALAFNRAFMIMPVESGDKYDVKNDMRGTGAWMLTKYEPSVGHEYRRNPNWFDAANRPFLDGIDYPIISDSAQRLAQFKAKRIWSIAPIPDQVLALKREASDTLMAGTSPLVTLAGYNHYGLGRLAGSPFEDVRMRYAVSHLIDRDAILDAFGNISGFAKEGVEVEAAWHTHIPAGYGGAGYWLDPKSNKLGETSKYFQYNPVGSQAHARRR